MQRTNPEEKAMSFDFSNSSINQFKAQATYKDGGGLGGGGMYMKQGKKQRNDQQNDDLFEFNKDENENDIALDSEIEEKDIPQDTLFNKFVNWFRLKN